MVSRRVFAQMSTTDVQAMLMQAARRFIQEMLAECLPDVWLRRAETFELVGTPTADETAAACRRHAWILATTGLPDEIAAEVDETFGILLGEVA